MGWRRNFADHQNALSQKSADKLIEDFFKCYDEAAEEMIPMFMEVYTKACASVQYKRDIRPTCLFQLPDYWTLQTTSKEKTNDLGNLIISLMNSQFHTMYADVFEGIAPGGIKVPCFISSEAIQTVIDGVWGVDKRNWRDRVWINMTKLWDGLTGELMEAIVKRRSAEMLQSKLKEQFNRSRQSLNSIMMIDVSRIQSKAAMARYKVSREMAATVSIEIAAYTMAYGDESEIAALTAEDIAAVNTLSDTIEGELNANEEGVATFGLLGSIIDFIGDLFDIAAGGGGDDNSLYIWICEGDDLVCEDCAEYDGAIVTGAEVDDIYPLHPNCRCVLEPIMEDDDDGDDDTLDVDDFEGGMSGGSSGGDFSDMMDDLGGYLDSIGGLF